MECEVPTFFDYSEPIARKEHACCECDAPIKVGEKHFHGRGKWGDEKPESYRQHMVCMEACMLIRDRHNGGECIGFGSLKEEFAELRAGWGKDRKHEPWRQLRALMAKILWRERKAKGVQP
jgi:hypothetical protein